MDINEIRRMIEGLFEEYGEYVLYEEDEINDLPDIIKNALQNVEPIYGYQDDSNEYYLESIAEEILAQTDWNLEYFVIDEAFDSPGLDIYVLSFILEYDGNRIYSFHNFYERN